MMRANRPSPGRSRLRCLYRGVLAVLVGCVLGIGTVHAAFFTVEVPVDGRTDAERDQAVQRGLAVVIGRMTGVHDDLEAHDAGELLGEADRFLAGFRFVRIDEGLALEVRFDGAALREALGEKEVAVWDARRPRILTWVAVDERGTRRMVELGDADDDPVYDLIADTAGLLHLPLMFPLMDLEDRARLGFREVWGGFERPMRTASQRYGSGPVLAVALRESSTGGWRGRWNVLVGDERLEHRVGPGPLDQVVEAGFHWTSSQLARRYAVVPGQHDGRTLEIGVIGIQDLAALQAVLAYLEQINGVAGAEVYRASGAQVGIRLQIERDPDRIVDALESADRLMAEALPTLEVGAGTVGGAARAYRWMPH